MAEIKQQQFFNIFTLDSSTVNDLKPNRFVRISSTGAEYADEGGIAVAVTMNVPNYETAEYNKNGNIAAVRGLIFVEAGEAISKGDAIAVGASGYAMKATSGDIILGYSDSTVDAANKKILFIPAFGAGQPSEFIWGGIGGDISEQTDLTTILTSKADLVAGKLNPTQLPPIAISDYLGNFADVATALADSSVQASQVGDWFTADGSSYIVIVSEPTTTDDIQEILTPGDVTSVNGESGVVVLTQDDVGDGTTYVRTENNLTDTLVSNIADNNAKISFDSTSSSKLAGIETGAEVNVQSDWDAVATDADDYIKNKPTTITTAQADAITANTTHSGLVTGNPHAVTATDLGLGNVTDGAEVNVNADWNAVSGDAEILNKPTTITVGQADAITANTTHISRTDNPHSVDKSDVGLSNVTNEAQIPLTQKGAANGVAELDSSGLILSSQLPSYVDDVKEYTDLVSLPVTGETGKIYVTLDDNLTYRWSGTAYVEISKSITLGETSSTAYRGDRGKTAYDHSQITTGNPHSVTAGDITDFDTEVSNNVSVLANSSKVSFNSTASSKLDGIAEGAEVNVQSDWDAVSGDALILNKPTTITTQQASDIITNNAKISFDIASSNKLGGIETGAEVNNISDVNATELVGEGDSTLHYHSSDRNRINHTGTQTASTISDFDTEVSNNSTVSLNTTHRGLTNNPHSVTPTQLGLVIGTDVQAHSSILDNTTASFNTTLLSKLNGIEESAEVNTVDSVNGDIGTVVLTQDDVGDGTTYVRTENNLTDTLVSNITANNAKVSNANHTGEVTGSTALTIADNVIDEANLKLDTAPTDDYVLTADSTASGGMKWAEASGGGGGTVQDETSLAITPADEGILSGNTRGFYALDLNLRRTVADHVASGYGSTNLGYDGTASGHYSLVVGGDRGEASGIGSSTIGGRGQVAYLIGQYAYGYNINYGDRRQFSYVTYQEVTSDNTPTEIFLDDSSARATIPNNVTWGFELDIVARDGSGNSALMSRRGLIKNVSSVPSIVGSIQTPHEDIKDTALSAIDVTMTADTDRDTLKVEVTGVAATSIRWQAKLKLVELEF